MDIATFPLPWIGPSYFTKLCIEWGSVRVALCQTAKLSEHHFLLYCWILDSLPACVQTAGAAMQKEQEEMCTQLSLEIFKCEKMISRTMLASWAMWRSWRWTTRSRWGRGRARRRGSTTENPPLFPQCPLSSCNSCFLCGKLFWVHLSPILLTVAQARGHITSCLVTPTQPSSPLNREPWLRWN